MPTMPADLLRVSSAPSVEQEADADCDSMAASLITTTAAPTPQCWRARHLDSRRKARGEQPDAPTNVA